MRKFIIPITLFCLFFSCQNQSKDPLRIAVAANMQYAMDSLVLVFEKETEIACEVIVGSSGKLATQIQAKAPYDIFISADTLYPQMLYTKGLTMDKPQVYSYGKLILWTLKEDIDLSLDILRSSEVKKIALANPKPAPYGRLTMKVLEEVGVLSEVEHKLVYGESISQTNQFILSKSVDLGITAQSAVFAPHLKNKGTWKLINVDRSMAQSMVILKNRVEQVPKAQKFEAFLFSEKGQEILKSFGYDLFQVRQGIKK